MGLTGFNRARRAIALAKAKAASPLPKEEETNVETPSPVKEEVKPVEKKPTEGPAAKESAVKRASKK